MRNFMIGVALPLLAMAAAAAAQSSRFGIPSSAVPYAGAIQIQLSTVGGLSTCDRYHIGILNVVTDAVTPTYNAAIAGNGNKSVLVMCNGTQWVAQ